LRKGCYQGALARGHEIINRKHIQAGTLESDAGAPDFTTRGTEPYRRNDERGCDMNEALKTRRNRTDDPDCCPIEATLARIGGKWKALIMLRLFVRTRRFNALLRTLPGCTQRMLTTQLRELEFDGLVRREVYHEMPPRVEYSLTEFGGTMAPVLRSMCEWGQAHVHKIEPDFETALSRAP